MDQIINDLNGKVVIDVDPGACRLRSQVIGWMNDSGKLEVIITSDCKFVQQLGKILGQMEPMEVLHMPFSENLVYAKGGGVLKHATCPVPLAILKCLEVAAGLGVKKDVHLTFRS